MERLSNPKPVATLSTRNVICTHGTHARRRSNVPPLQMCHPYSNITLSETQLMTCVACTTSPSSPSPLPEYPTPSTDSTSKFASVTNDCTTRLTSVPATMVQCSLLP